MWVVPTYGLAARGFAAAEKEGKLNSQLRAQTYAVQAQNLKLLKAAGAKFLMGTDTEGAIFEEAEHLVGLGAFDTLEALRMVLGTGRRLFPERRIGCFEPGCEADFIVLGADPTRDIKALREIRSLVKAGRELTPPPEQTK
jgi:imidazolonepropionase-like amidohydrolase